MGKVIFEYDSIEDRDDIKLHTSAYEFYRALDDIREILRQRGKGWIESPEDALQRIEDLIPYEKLKDVC